MPDENWSSRRQSHGTAMTPGDARFDAGPNPRKRKQPSCCTSVNKRRIWSVLPETYTNSFTGACQQNAGGPESLQMGRGARAHPMAMDLRLMDFLP